MATDPSDSRREHPEPGTLERFFRGQSAPGEAKAVVRHLLAGCPRCGGMLRERLRFAEEPLWDTSRFLVERGRRGRRAAAGEAWDVEERLR